MGGHNSYTFTRNASQLSYMPFKFSGESNSIKALRKETLVIFEILCFGLGRIRFLGIAQVIVGIIARQKI